MNKEKFQNIYDDPEFFASYLQLRNSHQQLNFNTLLEQPAIHSLLPQLSGSTVVDLGCGFGDLCRYMREQGAQSVLGIDISEKMLEIAYANTQDKAIQYQRAAMEDFSAPAGSIDLVVSSLALHYVADYLPIVEKVYACLKPGGYFIFSVEHPICTANPSAAMIENSQRKSCFPMENYRDEGQFKQTWFVENVIKYHRTLQTYVNGLMTCGFMLLKLLEPMPTDAMIAEQPSFYMGKVRPSFLLLSVMK